MSDNRLLGLALVMAPLSLISFGGGPSIIADMQHQTVAVHGWLTDRQFVDLFALSRAAPGPTTLIAALIGWQVAGWWGALVSALALFVPSSVLIYGASLLWHRYQGSAWRDALERGLMPIAVGLIFAGALTVLEAEHVDAIELATTIVATGLLLFMRISPYILLAAVAALYALPQVL